MSSKRDFLLRWPRRAALLLSLLALGSPAGAATPEITWKVQYFNFAPLADDLVLPMPCGGAMTFRPVLVPAERLLGDRRVTFGGSDDRFNFSENYRHDFVAGGFSAADAGGGRLFYLGKYEVTTDQYKAVSEPDCARASPAGRLPKAAVAWSEAITFSVRYTEWLYANAAKSLPSEDGVRGFLRLPTEAEWEYAARGGSAVSESDFLRPLFPMDGSLKDYAWYGSPDSSNFKPNFVGLLKANPLGLHDILGNVGEMVLEPYRLNKISRLHGEAGGLIVKGGDFFTSADALRTAQRAEMNPFDDGGLRRLETVGFRLMIGTLVVTSPTRLEAIKREWGDLPKSESPLVETQPLEDPLDEINLLIQSTEDTVLRERLTGLRTVIQANVVKRNEQRDRAVRSLLLSGVLLGIRLNDNQTILAQGEERLEFLRGAYQENEPIVQNQEKFNAQKRAQMDSDFGFYKDTVAGIAQDYPLRVIDQQSDVLIQELTEQHRPKLVPFVKALRDHLVEFRTAGDLTLQKILDDLRSP